MKKFLAWKKKNFVSQIFALTILVQRMGKKITAAPTHRILLQMIRKVFFET